MSQSNAMQIKFLMVLFILVFVSCDTEENLQVNCGNLKAALLASNADQVNGEINKLAQDLSPNPTTADPTGHQENLNKLIERLNNQCTDFQVTIGCYACILTLPAQSEIKIELDSLGTPVERVVDISTPENGTLKSLNVH